jgi:hypothetical protein
MTETIQLILELTGTFFVAVAFGWAVGKLRAIGHEAEPEPGALIRIRGRETMYRCRLDKVDAKLWTLGAPLARDSYFPLMKGEKITGQVTLPIGTLNFRAEVLCVDEFRGRVWLKTPKRTYLRKHPEVKIVAAPALFDGSGRFAR